MKQKKQKTHKILLHIKSIENSKYFTVQFFHLFLYTTPSGGHHTWNRFADNESHYLYEKDISGYVYEFMFATYMRYGVDDVEFHIGRYI